MSNRHISYIALGSNQGARDQYLADAITKLDEEPAISILSLSSIYETAPVGVTDQPSFLNMVVKVNTTLTPIELLETTQRIEQEGGRERNEKWGPRTIDIDILLFNDENILLESLRIPHPRMLERGFVLIPLKEIDPHLRLNDGRSIDEYIDQLTDKEGVRKWKNSFGEEGSARFEN
ncbi:2-amino-4-hydroxy-6-hydroxymethyldihydropteridine diphosphokinase [Salipaludibacillus keqinensis]|uniref:2-amino-4-hydroxy-6-hydroxymethyldihydropteridine diphosphokinase n=1 Tax=Salipaludibacillus keqinensis TaxID=2045207 RepID=A0A323TQJ3_9BACI|nr:2-amino-4-hydroxy-6-hydroxymethyldihydropteridine diphosphokinase [Salipaludibacillus keqinensis]PYZ91575.1 2-amino-4-hydroxy-6-hydroxymethyldihydropteridine diphosphokinase [Salipaludibacillus keqinensis]